MEIKVLGVSYPINFFKTEKENDNLLGTYSDTQIRICSDIPIEVRKRVLMHELIELLNWTGRYELPISKVEGLSHLLYSVMVDNPHIFSIKLEKLK